MNRSRSNPTKPTFLLFVLGAVLLIGLRMVLKLDFIDQQTGFYNAHSILTGVFGCAYAACLLGLLLLVPPRIKERKPLPNLRSVSWAATVWGMTIEFKALADGYDLFTGSARGGVLVNADLLLSLFALLLSVVTGLVVIVLAVNMASGALGGYPASMVLTATVLYQCFLLVGRFTGRTTPITVSDDILKIIMLVFSILFAVAHARVITRLNVAKGLHLLEFSGYAYALTALLLLLPELFGAAIGRLSLPVTEVPALLCSAALALYCIVFTRKVTMDER